MAAVQCSPESFHREVEQLVPAAVRRSFSFLLRSRAALALPLEAKSQTLRAAVTLNPRHVREMFEQQVLPRLEASLANALIQAVDGEVKAQTRQVKSTFIEALAS